MKILDAFDKEFGYESPFPHSARHTKQGGRMINQKRNENNVRRPTADQWEFCRFLALDKYVRETPPRMELIVLLESSNENVLVKEVRRPDFSLIRRYKCGSEKRLEIKDGIIPIKGIHSGLRGFSEDGYYRICWEFTNSNLDNVCEIGINGSATINRMMPENIIDCLYRAAMNMDGGAASQLSALHDTLDRQLAEAGEDVFIFELLQNANDYPLNEPVDVEFRIVRSRDRKGYLCFSHTGAPFTGRNVVAICSANDQDKSDNIKAIGYKGIGFKTVFRYNDRAEVRSGGFGFAFDFQTSIDKDGFPWRTIPRKVNPIMPDGFHVQIKLFPKDESKLGTGEGSYSSLLTKLFENEKPLLFIPNLGEVKIYLEDQNNPIVRSARSGNWCTSGQLSEKVDKNIREQIDMELKRDFEHCRIPPKYRNLAETAVSFACRRSGRRLVPEANACLFCYLPARDAQWGFRFLMNSDMIPNGSRNDIEYSIEINKYFARIAGGKLFVWIDSLIRSEQYDYDSIFALIPDFEECVKNRAEKVVEFIREFQAGFEAKLPDLQIPSASGVLVPISEVVYDTAGVISQFGKSFWERLGQKGIIAHKSLRECKEFKTFFKCYKGKLGILEFGFEELLSICNLMSPSLREWLSEPDNNGRFITFLAECGQLESFKNAPIFLDDHGGLDRSAEMFFYDANAWATDKYLGAFHKHIRHLAASTPCIERFKQEWFAPFDPRELVCNTLFSAKNAVESRELLKDMTTARNFFSFVVKYWRTTSGNLNKDVSRERFDKAFLQRLPAILKGNFVADAFCSDKYTIFIPDPNDSTQRFRGLKWIEEGWTRDLSEEYFNCEEGEGIRQLFIENEMIDLWNTTGVLTGIADKFKAKIQLNMALKGTDSDYYDFISLCLDEQCVNKDWIRQQLSNWPVVDAKGKLVFRSGKAVFYHNQELIDWINNGWVKQDAFVILNEKYSSQKLLFDLFNTRALDDNNFGQVFLDVLSPQLCLDTVGKVVAFHRYMANRRQLLVSPSQVSALSNAPKLLDGREPPKSTVGEVYLPSQMVNVHGMIESGLLSKDIQVLDARLCDSPEMLEYWKLLGCKELNRKELLQEIINAYLEKQEAFRKSSYGGFFDEHITFIRLVSSNFDKDNVQLSPLFETVKTKVWLLEKGNKKFELPKNLVLGTAYQPFCEYEKYAIPIQYVSDEYGAKAKSFLLALGVRESFSFADVCHFAKFPHFCRYFWTEYLPKCQIGKGALPRDWEKYFNVPCLLNKNGDVKNPSELYSPEVIEALGPVPGCDSHIPDFTGFHDREGDFAQSLGLRTTPYFSDVIEYLLMRDSDKSKAFGWIASYRSLSIEDQKGVQRYRESPNALLKNSQGNLCQIRDLIAISSKSENAKAFSSHPKVLMNRVLGKVEDREAALRLLGVKIIADSELNLEFVPSPKQDDLPTFLLPRLLVYVACREEEEWAATFDKYVSALSQCSFVRCDAIRYGYADMDMWLDRRRFYREAASRKFYYVGDSQGRQVFQCLAESVREWLGIKGDIEELKDVLDSETDIATMLSEKCRGLLDDERFVATLKRISPQIHDEVQRQLHEVLVSRVESQLDVSNPNDGQKNKGQLGVAAHEEAPGGACRDREAVKVQDERNMPDIADSITAKSRFDDLEAEQMRRVFSNNLTTEEMNDINRLDCIRLFNSLKAKGFEPRYLIGGNDQREREYDGRTPELLESDFINDVFAKKISHSATIETNDGRVIHVIGAINGVAHLPPKWWTRIAKQTGEAPGKYVVCAIVHHKDDGFRYIQTKNDLMEAIGDRFTVVRIQSESKEERFEKTLALFASNPECSDYSTYSLLLLHKMRSDTSYECVFTEDFKEDSHGEW